MKSTLKLLSLALISIMAVSCGSGSTDPQAGVAKKKVHSLVAASDKVYKHWVWARPSDKETDEQIAERYKKYKDAGVVGLYFESDNERHFRAAKKEGLQAHRWMWIMNRGDALKQHPEWAAISRSGKSTATNPPYVDYYRWMCPSRPEVSEFLTNEVENALKKDYIDGIHLDYVRFSDVVLAANLWQNYDIVQTQELPEYDFCYCDLCKAKFAEEYGQDLNKVEFPEESLSWRNFRYNAVSNIVGKLVNVAHSHDKPITAAVFPTPDVAKRLVRQDWTNWDLDAVYPMIYHGFYKENVQWIGDAVKEGIRGLDGRFPIYAGLYMPDFKDAAEVEEGIKYALDNGADGISIFGEGTTEVDVVLDILAKYKERK